MTANVALQTARTRTRKGIDKKKKYRIQATGALIGNDCTGINSWWFLFLKEGAEKWNF